MKKILLTLLGILITLTMFGQTVIEMANPGDAEIILLEVEDSIKADIIIYKTTSSDEAAEWDCMWKFKKWGFSNFGVYITKDENDTLLYDSDMEITHVFNAKVYFTEDKNCRGYRQGRTGIDGVMRVTKKEKNKKDQN